MRTMRSRFPRLLALLLTLSLAGPLLSTSAQDATTPAGPEVIVGTLSASNFAAASIYQNPVVFLIDSGAGLPTPSAEFVPDTGQIPGFATSPLFQPEPGTYQVNLPIKPTGSTVDFDGDATTGTGVQVYRLLVSTNIIGNTYLQQVEQSGQDSIIRDELTGTFLEGSLLVYADDDQQAFPTAFGDDGLWFTEDDTVAPVDAGYTVVHLSADGTATTDRSPTATMDVIEPASVASPDYSDQGILESFNSLIDRLAARYSYTELRGIDWEERRAYYLPLVEEADANNDFTAYAYVLEDLAISIQDAHVQLSPSTTDALQIQQNVIAVMSQPLLGNVGALTALLDDPDNPGETVVTIVAVGESGPAIDAGWVPGTKIVAVNGLSHEERLAQIPLAPVAPGGVGTPAKEEQLKSSVYLNFALDEEVTVDYTLPADDSVHTVTMVAGQYPQGITGPLGLQRPEESVWYDVVDNHTVIGWQSFTTDFASKIAIVEEALAQELASPTEGVIIDLRGNGGGWRGGYFILASYFFTADAPMETHVFDTYQYSESAQGLVKIEEPGWLLSSPKPELAYTGPLTILIDQNCASSCEFFTQHLQQLGRATVVAQYASAGAGGNIDRVLLPGGFEFHYTVGQSTFAGTDEFNIEQKGVTPDIWLPVTLETELPKLAGQDPVLPMTIAVTRTQPGGEADATPAVDASPSG